MPVPLLDLTRQNDELMPALLAKTEEVLRSGLFILGKEVSEFEREAAETLDAERSLAVSSGTDALLLALMAAGVGPGDEVVVPDFTFFATAGCVSRVGARPVFADICPRCFQISPDSILERISPNTKAIMPVHLFGQSADMTRIMEIAEEHDLIVIEDCAQSIGAKHRGKVVGTFGHYGAISFFPTKNLGGFGDGGLLLARNGEDFERAKILRVHGMEPKYHHPMIGGNFRMDALQAALLRIKLPYLGKYNSARSAHASYYIEKFGEHPAASLPRPDQRLEGSARYQSEPSSSPSDTIMILPHIFEENEVTWNQFTVRIQGKENRNEFRTYLTEKGIGSEIYYPVALSKQECYQPTQPNHCPNAETVAADCVSLPVFPEMTGDERNEVVETILSWLNQKA